MSGSFVLQTSHAPRFLFEELMRLIAGPMATQMLLVAVCCTHPEE